MKLKKLKYYIRRIMVMTNKELAVKILYRHFTHNSLDLNNPQTFNEKLQWMKLRWYDDRYPDLVDKYKVREYIREKGYEYILNDLYGVYDDPEEIDFDILPDRFILKGNHGGKMNLLVEDKSKLNRKKAIEIMNGWLNENYYYRSADWVYKSIKPRIICERNLCDKDGKVPTDYKFLCFDGEPQRIQVDTDRYGDYRSNFYDTEWNYLEYYPWFSNEEYVIEKPAQFEEMMEICRILSRDFIHVRVDLYIIDEEIKFGELTFFHGSGFDKFMPGKDLELGQFLKLPTE